MRTKVMGIVNVTPDSFSDGGKYFRPEEAVRRAKNMIAEGADIIDIGAESTRPDATPLSWQDEWSRLEPVLSCLVPNHQTIKPSNHPTIKPSNYQTIKPPNHQTIISVDTYHSETAERALAMGVGMINCVYPESAERMLALCDKAHADLIIPWQCITLVKPDFAGGKAIVYGDPMIGFATTRERDIELLRSVGEMAEKWPVAIGASRKRVVKKLTGEKMTGKNLGGNLAIALWCATAGASIIRVHDVKETVQALRVYESLMI